MSEAERAAMPVAADGLSDERAMAAEPLIRAMQQADRALQGLRLTEPPSGPERQP